jgi:hypothetical protein
MNFWQIILIAGFAFAIFGALSPFIVSYAQKKIQSDEVRSYSGICRKPCLFGI